MKLPMKIAGDFAKRSRDLDLRRLLQPAPGACAAKKSSSPQLGFLFHPRFGGSWFPWQPQTPHPGIQIQPKLGAGEFAFCVAKLDIWVPFQPELGARDSAKQPADLDLWWWVQPEHGASESSWKSQGIDLWLLLQAKLRSCEIPKQPPKFDLLPRMSSVRNGTNGTADPAKWPPKFDIWRQDFELEVGNQRPKGVCVYIYVYIYIYMHMPILWWHNMYEYRMRTNRRCRHRNEVHDLWLEKQIIKKRTTTI